MRDNKRKLEEQNKGMDARNRKDEREEKGRRYNSLCLGLAIEGRRGKEKKSNHGIKHQSIKLPIFVSFVFRSKILERCKVSEDQWGRHS